ncbi:MAG: hypothetical protein ACYC4R_10680 [Anaerolineae bacterium]
MQTRRARLVLTAVLLATILAGCQAVEQALYPGEAALTPAAGGTAVVAPEPSAPPAEAATSQPTPNDTPMSSAAPDAALVYLLDGSVYRGATPDDPVSKAIQVPAGSSYALAGGLLATAREGALDVLDLGRGEVRSVGLAEAGLFLNERLLWSTSGRLLLHSGLVEDAEAATYGRSIELRAMDPATGEQTAMLRIPDVMGVDALRYDDAAGLVTMIPRGGDPTFRAVQIWNLAEGALVRMVDVAGESTAALSPDGRLLLTALREDGVPFLALYDLDAAEGAAPRTWQLGTGTHAMSYRWAHDGQRVAFLMREGQYPWDDSPAGLGLWVLDVTTMQAAKLADEASPLVEIVGWSPNDGSLLVRRPGADGAATYEVLNVAGGARSSLELPAGAVVLGWIEDTGAVSPLAEEDAWATRFQEAASDGAATAALVARFVVAHAGLSDEELTAQVREQLQAAGWELGLAGPQVKKVSQGLYVAQLPPNDIYILDAGRASAVAQGDRIVDVRGQGDDLGLIYAMIGASAEQPAYQLLRRQEGGGWQSVWTPAGRRDWIATDGEIAFLGEGLDHLRVTGSSFGLELEGDAFAECHACLHRRLVGQWDREGDTYVRATNLSAETDIADVYWEMSERGPYAVLHEVLRRAGLGMSVDELVADAGAIEQLRALGFLEEGVQLQAEQESADTVTFGDGEGRYVALVQAGKLVSVERLDA